MAKVAKKQRKFGRNKDYSVVYSRENKREKNKIAKLQKYLEKRPGDKEALAAVERCKLLIRGY